jgi:hypothetical protein
MSFGNPPATTTSGWADNLDRSRRGRPLLAFCIQVRLTAETGISTSALREHARGEVANDRRARFELDAVERERPTNNDANGKSETPSSNQSIETDCLREFNNRSRYWLVVEQAKGFQFGWEFILGIRARSRARSPSHEGGVIRTRQACRVEMRQPAPSDESGVGLDGHGHHLRD